MNPHRVLSALDTRKKGLDGWGWLFFHSSLSHSIILTFRLLLIIFRTTSQHSERYDNREWGKKWDATRNWNKIYELSCLFVSAKYHEFFNLKWWIFLSIITVLLLLVARACVCSVVRFGWYFHIEKPPSRIVSGCAKYKPIVWLWVCVCDYFSSFGTWLWLWIQLAFVPLHSLHGYIALSWWFILNRLCTQFSKILCNMQVHLRPIITRIALLSSLTVSRRNERARDSLLCPSLSRSLPL